MPKIKTGSTRVIEIFAFCGTGRNIPHIVEQRGGGREGAIWPHV